MICDAVVVASGLSDGLNPAIVEKLVRREGRDRRDDPYRYPLEKEDDA